MDTKSNSNWFHDLFIKEAKASFSRHASGSSPGDPGTDAPDDGNKIKDKGVLFIDYDGTYLYSYTVKEAQKLTELPTLPEHEGLICQGWNWTLEQIKEQNGEVVVGPYYITDDETTRLYITVTDEIERRVSIAMGFNNYTPGVVTIDWGDGTIETFKAKGIVYHEYVVNGDYVIKVSSEKDFDFDADDSNGTTPFGENTDAPGAYSTILKKIECGKYGTFSTRGLRRCSALKTITVNSGRTFGGVCFEYASALKAFVGNNNSFAQCYGLENVSLNPDLKTIGSFSSATNLVKVTIPNTVTSFSTNAFKSATKLSKINIPTSVTSIPSELFNGATSLTDLDIPDSVTSIGATAFSGTSFEEFTIPDTVTSLGSSAFKNCVKLKTVKISSGITSIQGSTFESCCMLEQVEIPAGVTSIASKAFYNCESLKKVVFKGSPSIAANAFAECGEMQLLDFTACTAVPVLSNANAFAFVDGNTGATVDYQIRVPAALYDEWIAATNWSTYASRIVAV